MSIYKALAEAKKKIKPFKKESDNPYFKAKYADLETIKQAVDPALSECGLMIVTRVTPTSVITSLVHIELGDAIDSEFPLTPNLDAQKRGSEITYARRYSLQSLLDLVAEDDDGNMAGGKHEPVPKKEEFDAVKKAQTFQKIINEVDNLDRLKAGRTKFEFFQPDFKRTNTMDIYNETIQLFEQKKLKLFMPPEGAIATGGA